MRIDNVSSGVEFEQFIMELFRQGGASVMDTPSSNDYGADVIIEYEGIRYSAQCKYYTSKAVGVNAVQEVMGSLNVYYCDYGMVITNVSFTQQAINLAAANHILLVDGELLSSFMRDLSGIGATFESFINRDGNGRGQYNQASADWVIHDLEIRYGVSSAKIYKDFLGRGLPYYKVGREYRFNPDEVFWWEVHTRSIPYGKNDMIALPGYEIYRMDAQQRLRQAGKEKNKEEVKRIKQEMRSHGVKPIKNYFTISDCLVPIAFLVIFTIIFFLLKSGN